LKNDSFISKGLKELKKLSLNRCGLEAIEFGAFNGLTKLTRLSLRHNKLLEIIPRTFEKNSFLKYLDLSHNKLEHLESDIFFGSVKIIYINLKGNKLQYLQPDTFSGLPNLQKLYLSKNSDLQIPNDSHFITSHSLKRLGISGCNVSSVSVATFVNIRALEWLDLSYNNLRSLDINTLILLPKLSVLYLNYNEISEIIPCTFETFSHLQYLRLDYNKIEHLESYVFWGFFELNYINLEGNKLQYLHPDTFSGLPNLQKLYLSKNSDLQVPNDRHFITSHSLKHLGISGCNVSSVPDATFVNVPALEWLDLSYNNLKSLDVNTLEALPELSVLYLYDNPLHCDYQLLEVWRWCQHRNITTFYGGKAPECVTPWYLNSVSFGDLENNSSLQDIMGFKFDLDFESPETKKQMSILIELYELIRHVRIPVVYVLSTFGITGNVILVIIITCDKNMRNIPNMYILNLGISDLNFLTQIFLNNTLVLLIPNPWDFNYIVRLVSQFGLQMAVVLTAYSVAVLSVQRYSVTVKSLQVRVSSQTSRRATVATICGVWIVAALLAVPKTLLVGIYGPETLWEFYTYIRIISLLELLLFCVLPLCVITFSYCLTSRHLVKNSFYISGMAQNPQIKKRRNAAKVVLGLAIVFAISYVPSYILCTFFSFYFSTILREFVRFFIVLYLKEICICFVCLNSCLNPVAVFCTSLAFRMHLKRYVTRCCTKIFPPY